MKPEKKQKPPEPIKITNDWVILLRFQMRHLAIITYRLNEFFAKKLSAFASAMSLAEELRANMRLKKTVKRHIFNLKTMVEMADIVERAGHETEANLLREVPDLSGRVRTWGIMSDELFGPLVGKLDKDTNDEVRLQITGLQALTNRMFDYSTVLFAIGSNLTDYSELEKKYLMWPTAVRTALYMGARYIHWLNKLTKVPLLDDDPTPMLEYMRPAEFALMINLDETLSERSEQAEEVPKTWEMPVLYNAQPELLLPITPENVLLKVPTDMSGPKRKRRF